MKKLTSVLLILVLLFSAASCSKTHYVLSKKDSDYVKEIIDKYCIEQNTIPPKNED